MTRRWASLLIADDHAVFRAGLRLLLERVGTFPAHLHETECTKEGVSGCLVHAPFDLILLGLHTTDHKACIQQLTGSFPDTPLVILAASEAIPPEKAEPTAGSRAFIRPSDTPEHLLQVIERSLSSKDMASGNHRNSLDLTPRQMNVLIRVCAGKANKEIARELGMSENTVRVHLHDIFITLGVTTRTQAAMRAKDSGIV